MSQYGIVCEQNVFCYLTFQLQKALTDSQITAKKPSTLVIDMMRNRRLVECCLETKNVP